MSIELLSYFDFVDTEVYYDFDGVYKDEDLHIEAQENGIIMLSFFSIHESRVEFIRSCYVMTCDFGLFRYNKGQCCACKPAKKEKKVEKKEEKDSGDDGEEDSDFGVEYDASLDGADSGVCLRTYIS